MTISNEHAVGLRELRHKTSEVLARVRHGETIDVTEYGRLVARIVPVDERDPTPVLDRLAAEG
ncbi:type II toxin-antitoxin system Phd/YefM family antitoxin [Kribbella sp. NPDC055110]